MIPREITAKMIERCARALLTPHQRADEILSALHAAGYRLIGPGELDQETIERCAEVADTIGDQYDAAAFSRGDDVAVSACRHKETASHHIAAALRALQSQEARNEG